MSAENTVDKVKLISELKEIHSELFQIYKRLFEFKYKHNEVFKSFIDKEYKENGVGSKEKKAWNDNFCHRASYTLLNKILFVRICEDKGFMRNEEDYIAGEVKDPHIGEKLSKVGLQKWGRLITNYSLGELVKFAFNDMKQSYSNIVLYKEDKYEILNPRDEEFNLKYINGNKDIKTLVLEFEDVLNNIIEKLDTNNFNFKYTDGNILGDVYEKFMDRETRKAIGQFYTPEFVIEYILKNTVEEADIVENPFVTVADISCGSGHFLIMAYDILREKFMSNLKILKEKYAQETFTIKRDGKEIQLIGKEYWVKEYVHYHILKHCIYGADIDSFAVQLTTINLLLKDLDNFTDELNIIECDSLIKWEKDYDWQGLREQLNEELEIEIFTQPNLLGEEEQIKRTRIKEKFKLNDLSSCLENYELNRQQAEEMFSFRKFWNTKFNYIVGNPPYGVLYKKNTYAKNKYYTAQNTLDTYGLFIERATEKCNHLGKVGLIVPSSWQTNTSFKSLREYLLKKTSPKLFVNLPYDIFGDAYIDTVTFVIERYSDNSESDFILCEDILTFTYGKKDKINKINIENSEYTRTSNKRWIDDFEYKFETFQSKIDTIIVSKIEQGVGCLNDYAIVNRGVTPFNLVRYMGGGETYRTAFDGQLLRYNIKWETKKYIDYTRDKIKEFKDESLFKGKRILLRVLISRKFRLQAALIEEDFINNKSIQNIIPKDSSVSAEYLLGIINSKLISFYVNKKYATVQKDDFPQIFIKDTRNLPIVIAKKERIIEIEQFVKELQQTNLDAQNLSFYSCLKMKNYEDICDEYIKINNNRMKLTQKLNDIDEKIDSIIYEIYGLNSKEIQHINEFFLSTRVYSSDERIEDANNEDIENIDLYDSNLVTNVDFKELYNEINYYFIKKIIDNLVNYKKYSYLNSLRNQVESSIDNFEALIGVMRKDKPTKKTLDIIKEALNTDAYTWNAFRKDKAQDKINKTFVKYYDNNCYGLTEWSDEIHKQYFMDAIDEYTSNNSNEKKAKDILKLFKELDIEDKEDYVDIIEDKIKRAFS